MLVTNTDQAEINRVYCLALQFDNIYRQVEKVNLYIGWQLIKYQETK